MIKALIVDDEIHCLDTMAILIGDYCPGVQVMEQCNSAKMALAAIARYQPDLIFLDIEMPLMNGFEMLEEFEEIPFAVIFTTSYNQYAIKAIRFSALDFLLKPIDPKELVAAIYKIQTQKHRPTAAQYNMLQEQIHQKENSFNRIALPTFEGFEMIPANQIVRCESDDNYTHLYLKNNTKIVASRTLKDIEELLQYFPAFTRVHNSYLVNLNEVTRYVRGEGGYLVMSDGSTISVSRSRKELLLKKLIPGKE
jgi:two-component system, LytTR family, response regulator